MCVVERCCIQSDRSPVCVYIEIYYWELRRMLVRINFLLENTFITCIGTYL